MLGRWVSNLRNLAALYVGMLVISAGVVGSFLYIAYQSNAYSMSKAAIEADMSGLVDIYHYAGADTVRSALEQRLNHLDAGIFYMLYHVDGSWLTGNLKTQPNRMTHQDGDFIVYAIPYDYLTPHALKQQKSFASHYHVMTKVTILGDAKNRNNIMLMVGRDVHAFQKSQAIITGLAWITAALTTLIAFIGFFMASMILKRVRLIDKTATRVIETGDLSARIPESEARGDFKPLAHTFNAMLTRIEDSVTAIRQVSDNIAHDLRTPLTRLQQHIDAIKAGKNNVDINDVADETTRIIKTFHALLRISNIEHGKRSADFTDVHLRVLLEDLYEYYHLLTQEKHQTLYIELPATMPYIRGDKDMLFQAFSNMIENAMKYTPEGGVISIQASNHGAYIYVSIQDNGPGVCDADKPKIFRRFFRTENSRHTPGNGFGLALVKAIMDLHQAKIRLKDKKPSGLEITIAFHRIA